MLYLEQNLRKRDLIFPRSFLPFNVLLYVTVQQKKKLFDGCSLNDDDDDCVILMKCFSYKK